MSKEVLRAIAGIDLFPVISLVLFVVVFTAAVIRALRLDRRLVEQLSLMPLDAGAADHDQEPCAFNRSPLSEVSRGDHA